MRVIAAFGAFGEATRLGRTGQPLVYISTMTAQWASNHGRVLGDQVASLAIGERTLKGLGVHIGSHFICRCVATTAAF